MTISCLLSTPSVPFEEDDNDASIWFLDHSYMEQMAKMFKKVNGKACSNGPTPDTVKKGLHGGQSGVLSSACMTSLSHVHRTQPGRRLWGGTAMGWY